MGSSEIIKVRVRAHGRVQGVGFRRFVYKLAQTFPVCGWVRNNPDGSVDIDVTGETSQLSLFLERVKNGSFLARVDELEEMSRETGAVISGGFVIRS